MNIPTPAFDEHNPPPDTARKREIRSLLVLTPQGWQWTQTDLPTVSVLVPVLNEASYLAACLDAIFSQYYPPQLVEVLVIDGGSTDGSRDIVTSYRHRHPNLRLLVNPDGWSASALNRGIQAASGEIIVRVDGHTFIARDYIRRAVAALEAGGVAAVGGGLRPVGDTDTGRIIAAVMAHPLGGGPARFRHTRQPTWVDTVYLGAWHKKTLQQLGGFNPTLAANEDFELFYRLRRAGGRVLCDPRLRSWTVVRRTLRGLWRQYTTYGYWKARMLRQHPQSLRWRQLPAPLLTLSVVLLTLLSWAIPLTLQAALVILVLYGSITALAAVGVALSLGWRSWPRAWLAFWIIHWGWGWGFWKGLLESVLPI